MDLRTLAERLSSRFNIRFPTLFLLFAFVTLVDFIVPDVLPFVDELGFLLVTMILGSWKRRRPRVEPGR